MAPVAGKGDMFLQLESQRAGSVKGESSDPKHPDEIQVTHWSWGMTSSTQMGAAGTAVKTALSELHIHKRADSATTALMSVMRNNDTVKKAVLSVRKSGGSPIDYLVITLQNARITSYEIVGAQEDDPDVSEHFTLTFESIDITYYPQDAQGQRKGGSSFTAQVGSQPR
jgi:type VI secretion system secreted protein Hcp